MIQLKIEHLILFTLILLFFAVVRQVQLEVLQEITDVCKIFISGYLGYLIRTLEEK